MTVHDPLYAVAEHRGSKINKQPQGLLRQSKVGQELLAVDGG